MLCRYGASTLRVPDDHNPTDSMLQIHHCKYAWLLVSSVSWLPQWQRLDWSPCIPVKVFYSFVVLSACPKAQASVAQEVHVGSAIQLHCPLKVSQGSIRSTHLLQQQPSGIV